MVRIIDHHTHIKDEKIYQDYFRKAKGKISKAFVNHEFEFSLKDLLDFTSKKDNLYVLGSVNIETGIKDQLDHLGTLFQKNKIIGIKLYPGYQHFYPSDKKIHPIAELCQQYNKPLVFHSGDVYDPEGKAILRYSRPIYIDDLAVRFPECKVVIAHFGFPYLLEAANVVNKNKNVYTDISGTIMEMKSNSGKEIDNLINQYTKDLLRVFSYFPDVKEKVMFGTDYGGEHTPLNMIEPYIEVVRRVFSKSEQENVFYGIADRLFLEN